MIAVNGPMMRLVSSATSVPFGNAEGRKFRWMITEAGRICPEALYSPPLMRVAASVNRPDTIAVLTTGTQTHKVGRASYARAEPRAFFDLRNL
jgi:hypothetical protein